MKRRVTLTILALTLIVGMSVPSTAMAKDFEKEFKGVELMGAYIDFLAHWIDIVEKPANAIGIAQNSLKDLYLENNEPERLEQTLMHALEIVHDRGARNSIRFTLAEFYQEQGQAKKASEQLIKVIEENAKGVMKKSKTISVFE